MAVDVCCFDGVLLCSVAGLAYSAKVFHRAARPMSYKPVLEDWIWYAIVPSFIYVVLTVAALLLRTSSEAAHFIIAGAALGLLMVGIRNVWDSVTHIVTGGGEHAEKGGHE